MTASGRGAISGYARSCRGCTAWHSPGADLIFTLGYVTIVGMFWELIK